MSKNIFQRLNEYYSKIAEVLRGEADVSSVFKNTTDKGLSREQIYVEFLKNHVPSKCNVFLGGFVFDEQGNESNQLDILITTDTTPRFKPGKSDKSFSPIEGTLGIVSVKSKLDKQELYDALDGIASIPLTKTLNKRVMPLYSINDYEDWPFKVIYATNGINSKTLINHLNNYYKKNPTIPLHRRPNMIHVSGECFIMRVCESAKIKSHISGLEIPHKIGEFGLISPNPDLQAIIWILNQLQDKATDSSHIIFSYHYILEKVLLNV